MPFSRMVLFVNHKEVSPLPTYTHGGDIWTRSGVLDFSANLHPLGMPPQVAQAAREAVTEAIHYPDPLCRALRAAIAERDGVKPEQVICGNGAADLIFRLCLALKPRRALVTAPTFSEYEEGLRLTGCTAEHFLLSPERQFDLDASILEHIVPGVDLLFLCSPNNPTGRLIDRGLLGQILRRCAEAGTRLVLDECFIDLTDGAGMAWALEQHPYLFLLRAFTKTYAVPGLRLGYGLCGDADFLERLYAGAQPWSVSNVAQAAGVAACACRDWPERGREILRAQRPRLLEALCSLGCTVWAGEANYLLFRAPGVADLKERLLERNILIRSCANYHGLGPDFYRVCVRREEENTKLIAALREVL